METQAATQQQRSSNAATGQLAGSEAEKEEPTKTLELKRGQIRQHSWFKRGLFRCDLKVRRSEQQLMDTGSEIQREGAAEEKAPPPTPSCVSNFSVRPSEVSEA